MEFYSPIKKKTEITTLPEKWVKLESIVLSELTRLRKKQIPHVFSHLWILDFNFLYVHICRDHKSSNLKEDHERRNRDLKQKEKKGGQYTTRVLKGGRVVLKEERKPTRGGKSKSECGNFIMKPMTLYVNFKKSFPNELPT